MTLEQIKAAMKERKIEAPDLAKELGVNVNSLRQILAGQRTLTEQLSRHIAHVLGKSECIFVYRVTVSDAKVEELTAGRGCTSEKERLEAMKQIVEHNMLELARLGASLDWTPQQREAWGLDPIPRKETAVEEALIEVAQVGTFKVQPCGSSIPSAVTAAQREAARRRFLGERANLPPVRLSEEKEEEGILQAGD